LNLFILKLGGSVLTDKDKEFSLRERLLRDLAGELSSLEEKFVLVHGGGSFGHPLASKYDISSGFREERQLVGFSKTREAMEKLNFRVVKALNDAGIPAISIQTSAFTVVEDGKIISMNIEILQKLLEIGIIPVLYGDSVVDIEKGMSILSGDQLLAEIAKKLDVSEVILGVDTDGVYTRDPKENEDAELIPKITPESWENIKNLIEFPTESDVTGGMKNKVEVLVNLAREGIESRVINATKGGNITKCRRRNKKVGTKISRE